MALRGRIRVTQIEDKGVSAIGISPPGGSGVAGPKKADRRNFSDLPAPVVGGRTGLTPVVCGF